MVLPGISFCDDPSLMDMFSYGTFLVWLFEPTIGVRSSGRIYFGAWNTFYEVQNLILISLTCFLALR